MNEEELKRLIKLHGPLVGAYVALAKGVIGPESIRPGGALTANRAMEFISLVWNAPFFQQITTTTMRNLKTQGAVLNIASRSLRRVAEGSEPADGDKTSVTQYSYNLDALPVQLFMDLLYSFLIDNQDNPKLKAMLEADFLTRFQAELIDLGFNGTLDDNSAGFLTLNKGWVTLAKAGLVGGLAGQQVDIDPATDGWIDSLALLIDAMPDQFLGQARFIMNTKDALAYGIEIGKHVTGSAVIADPTVKRLVGIDILENPFMPRNYVIYTPPKNLVVGMAQDIQRGVNDHSRKRAIEYTWSAWCDFTIAVMQAVVLGKPADPPAGP